MLKQSINLLLVLSVLLVPSASGYRSRSSDVGPARNFNQQGVYPSQSRHYRQSSPQRNGQTSSPRQYYGQRQRSEPSIEYVQSLFDQQKLPFQMSNAVEPFQQNQNTIQQDLPFQISDAGEPFRLDDPTGAVASAGMDFYVSIHVFNLVQPPKKF